MTKEFDSSYKYIKPMENEGMLALTMPDKPKSKYQKYYTKNELIKGEM